VAAEAEGQTGGGIGARLRAGRERLGLSVLQAAEKLHIDVHVIEALEAERFAALGAAVFVRGHIRRYAELVREPAAELQGLYAASSHASVPPDITRVPRGDSMKAPISRLIPGIAIVVAVALIGSIWWVVNDLSRAPEKLAQQPQALPPMAPAAGAAAPAPPPAPVPAAAAARIVPAAAPTTAAAGPTAASAAALGGGRPTEVRLRFNADSWVEIYDARGERLFYDIGAAGSERTVSGAAPLKVVLGNAPAVALEVNGHPVTLPEAGSDNALQFGISRSGRIVPARLLARDEPHP